MHHDIGRLRLRIPSMKKQKKKVVDSGTEMSETTIRESTTNHMNTRGDTNTKEINITDSEKRHHKAEQHAWR